MSPKSAQRFWDNDLHQQNLKNDPVTVRSADRHGRSVQGSTSSISKPSKSFILRVARVRS
ncbi:hypothetical protein ELI38_26280 (plasmid) [Rhizobium leguminosarum]|uniref:Uncharacterized protein n=1 Tax=Rhizobium leguminosarum TaxID=384 RepID=A0A7M3DMS9_RHILE|nr:hypothetical protein [Rhizobium leguminosarum bv. viciae]PUB66163.1 hypothetical protein DB728_03125 [Rhizobium leguminosarum bv. viciae USDA 2370]RWX38875.1 hypothetical protein EHH54_17125 [Rhizobium leguminosarum]NKJ92061.1 hypothetical protein [Rhizobium leguminosarum bv. viciae]NKK11972.1 hypothetical protein [Rhizobium leguminosarum bv. viciae]